MQLLIACPVCDNEAFTTFLECRDHFLSKEIFTISKCEKCGFLFTNPRPKASKLSSYYQSEEYISHSNSRKGFQNILYQMVRNYTISQKLKLILNYKITGSILDIGCATGEFLNHCKSKKWNVLGIEPNESARRDGIENYSLVIEDETHLSTISQSSFDVITMWHVLEHVPLLNERMDQLQKLLRPDGYLFIAVPNANSLDAKLYNSFWAAYDVPRHLYHFTRDTISQLFSRHSFELINTVPMKFDAYYVSILSEKYIHLKNNFLNGLLSGYASNRAAHQNKEYSSMIYVFKKTTA
jgi:2-polyprenyl-3-methyl-5-hydroxy-6-metoxy-1,4-benzoquinol methylase